MRVARYHVRTYCPGELCSFSALIGGCATPEEAIDCGKEIAKVHSMYVHGGLEDELTFEVFDADNQKVEENGSELVN